MTATAVVAVMWGMVAVMAVVGTRLRLFCSHNSKSSIIDYIIYR
jgi:hypothetical protein